MLSERLRLDRVELSLGDRARVTQSVFVPPPTSCRRKMSPNTRKRIMIQMTKRKKMHIVQKTLRNG